MPLTEAACRAAAAQPKQFKIADGRGLSLLILPSGAKKWVHRYRFAGATRDDTLGDYPVLTLARARAARDAARALATDGRDPRAPDAPASSETRPRYFRNVAQEWFDKVKRPALEPRTADRQWSRLSGVFGEIGDLDVGAVTSADVLRALQVIETRGAAYTARRVRGMLEAAFDYAHIPYGVAVNPASQRLLRAMAPVPREQHHPALEFSALPLFYSRLRGPRCAQAVDDTRTRLMIELAMHVVLRHAELRFGLWEEIGADVWAIPGARMKKVAGVERDHLVPLTPRALEILAALRPAARRSGLIFAGLRPGRPMSEATATNWLKSRGYAATATVHGFRTMFSTHANEHGWNRDWIELQLHHVERDKVRDAYNRAKYLDGRRKMMTWWSAQLIQQDKLGKLL